MSYWKLAVSMKLGLLGCSRRAVSIEIEKRTRVKMWRQKNSVGDVFKTVVGCAGADETDAKVISEIKIMQDAW
jgi:hypothetical protein